ncbi:GAF domain-containing sensor histidine kinase [Polyangium fumosum]|nr:ATP-binding protein [Polyangium fumosum]
MTAAVGSLIEPARLGEGARAEGREPSPVSLVGVVQDLSLVRDMPALMEVVRKAARELTGADGATFVLRDGDLCYYAEENAIEPLWKGRRFPMTACISGWSMIHREAVVIEDIYEDPRIPFEAYRPTFVKSLCMVPIRTKAPIGAIGNYWATRHLTTPYELALLQALANSTSVAMENVEVYAELEKRVQDRTRELEEKSQRLAEEHAALLELQRQKEALSALVVHDLKSPAAAIVLAASLQLRSPDLGPAERRRWGVVFSSAERIVRTAASVLDIAQSEEGRLVPRYAVVDLGGLIAEIREQLLPLAEKREQGIEVSCDVPEGALWADRELLGRTLQNLVDNAIRHSPTKSTVRIEAHADAAWVTVAICDEGPGVPVEMRQCIFDRYVRVEEKGRTGWGLGLAFCKMAVEAHGGTSWIEDNVPRGSRFCFRLPVVRAGAS